MRSLIFTLFFALSSSAFAGEYFEGWGRLVFKQNDVELRPMHIQSVEMVTHEGKLVHRVAARPYECKPIIVDNPACVYAYGDPRPRDERGNILPPAQANFNGIHCVEAKFKEYFFASDKWTVRVHDSKTDLLNEMKEKLIFANHDPAVGTVRGAEWGVSDQACLILE